jgi:hypothetical protein
MTQEELNAVLAAQPSFMDGQGLFPGMGAKSFGDGSPAVITRSADDPIPIKLEDAHIESSDPATTPAPSCPTSGTITVVLSGIDSCGCTPADGFLSITAFSGLNGAHTLTWDAGSSAFVLNNFGSVTQTNYTDPGCLGAAETFDGSFNITASCSDGNWSITIIMSGLGLGIFESTPAPRGTPMTNAIVCPTSQEMGGGTATVS